MKWPFVRRSKYESMINERNEQKGYKERWEDQANNLLQTNTYNMVEINRLNQELASELNAHRETKKESAEDKKAYEHNINFERECNEKLEKEIEETKEKFVNAVSLLEYCHKIFLNTEKELEETKDALKIAQDDNKKLDKVNEKWWIAIKMFVDSINLARTDFMNNK